MNLRRESPTYVMPKFTLELLLQAIHRYKITYLVLVPPIAVLLIRSPLVSQYDISSVQFLLCGAAPLGKETSMQLEKLFQANNAVVRQGWGMSEATCSAALFAPDEHDPEHLAVGYLCANMEAKVVADDGREVGYGEKGEAVLRGPNVFQGYFKNPEATRESWTEDGWLKTGDYVMVQPNGLVSVVDRKKVGASSAPHPGQSTNIPVSLGTHQSQRLSSRAFRARKPPPRLLARQRLRRHQSHKVRHPAYAPVSYPINQLIYTSCVSGTEKSTHKPTSSLPAGT